MSADLERWSAPLFSPMTLKRVSTCEGFFRRTASTSGFAKQVVFAEDLCRANGAVPLQLLGAGCLVKIDEVDCRIE
jgi:hypothetical protein